jgi:DGQHR domain-containing protein
MADDKWITFSCIQITQPIGSFYIGVIDSVDLVRISFADRRTIHERKREIEVVSGIQRQLSEKRVEELRKYVLNVDASFPTGIILAANSEDAEFDPKTSTIRLRDRDNVAKIIDGQHRIEGLVNYRGEDKFQLNVTLFIDMDMEDQAILFSTINLKQTPVSKSLAYDLFDYAQTRSPQKTSHNIATVLNRRPDSPFYRKIMILGTATGHPNETLTQAAFIEPLMGYISKDPMTDRDTLRRGKKLPLATPAEIRVNKLIFRNLFIEERDAEIAKLMLNYFKAVAERWPDAWELRKPGLVLNRTTGYRALMRFLPLASLSVGRDLVVPAAEFRAIFNRVKLEDADFTPEKFKPGSTGQRQLFDKLTRDTGLDEHSLWKNLAD